MGESSIQYLSARIIIDSGAVRIGRFRLSSGEETDIYIDARSILGKPEYFKRLLALLYIVYSDNVSSDGIVGIATGGIPWATGLALLASLPFGYVRPKAKSHGLTRRVEGVSPPLNVVVVDDVATTGHSISTSIKALRSEGFTVDTAMVLVDRESGASRMLKNMGVRLIALTSLSIIRQLL